MTHSKVALITGASSGIGKAVALKLQASGYDAVLSARRLSELEKVAGEATKGGGRVMIVACDVADPASVKALFAKAKDTFGRLDVLFNNAGIFAQGKPLEDIALEDWKAAAGILNQLADARSGPRTAFEAFVALAKLHETKLGDRAAAVADYRKLLIRFPSVPFKDRIESEIRRLGG